MHSLVAVLCAPRGAGDGGTGNSIDEAASERDKALVGDIRGGGDKSERAFEELFRAYIEGLVRFAVSYVDDVEIAREIVSEMFLNLWQNRDSWNPEHGAGVYLYGAVRNRSLNHLRSRKRKSRLDQAVVGEIEPIRDTPDMVLESAEIEELVNKAIDALPEPRRQAVILRWRHQMQASEIAQILGISQGAVYQLLNRSYDLLRKLLGPTLR